MSILNHKLHLKILARIQKGRMKMSKVTKGIIEKRVKINYQNNATHLAGFQHLIVIIKTTDKDKRFGLVFFLRFKIFKDLGLF